ncbi:hypothetical protein L218DRAFT_1040605 [Marasmius fiardii PR-910]|nr:hypothetical protein L218DRAFT_1040605 [Marasmius fiardii PR-910]
MESRWTRVFARAASRGLPPSKPFPLISVAENFRKGLPAPDKFGDVFSYTLHPSPPPVTGEEPASEPTQENAAPTPPEPTATPASEPSSGKRKRKSKKNQNHYENPPHPRDSVDSHVNPSNGTLVLGHTSLLTSFLFSHDEKFIITADRDEHIRVSWYPQGYSIESFCLGCSEFVSSLHIPKSHPDTLISGGGDPEIKLWEWRSGKLISNIPVLDRVKEYTRVKALPYIRKNSKGKARSKAKSEAGSKGESVGAGEDDPMEGGDSVSAAPSGSNTPAGARAIDEDEEPGPEDVFIVQKIETVERNGELFIIFSVVGATAIFCTPFPSEKISSSSDVPSSSPTIHAFDFSHPVLDFTLDPNPNSSAQRLIWVSVDNNLKEGTVSWEGKTVGVSDGSSTSSPTRVVEIDSDGTITEPLSVPEGCKALLEALNSTSLVSCTESELGSLNFYSSLTSLPKNTQGEDEGDGGEEDGIPDPQAKPKKNKRDPGPTRNKKEEGKMKSKRAILEMERQRQLREGRPETPDQVGGRETKRHRSEVEAEAGGEAEKNGDVPPPPGDAEMT